MTKRAAQILSEQTDAVVDLATAITVLCAGHNGLAVLGACMMVATDVLFHAGIAKDDQLTLVNDFATGLIVTRPEKGHTVQ